MVNLFGFSESKWIQRGCVGKRTDNSKTARPMMTPHDRVKSLDWNVRRAVKKGVVSSTALTETLGKLHTLL